jgi:hypothetical protein
MGIRGDMLRGPNGEPSIYERTNSLFKNPPSRTPIGSSPAVSTPFGALLSKPRSIIPPGAMIGPIGRFGLSVGCKKELDAQKRWAVG